MNFKYRTFYLVRTYDGYDDYWTTDGIFLSKANAEIYADKLRKVCSNVYVEEYDIPTDYNSQEE